MMEMPLSANVGIVGHVFFVVYDPFIHIIKHSSIRIFVQNVAS